MYILIDFFNGRTGKILVFSVILVLLFLWVGKQHRESEAADEKIQAKLPHLPSAELWADDRSGASDEGRWGASDYSVTERREGYAPLRAPAAKLDEPPVPKLTPIIKDEPFQPLAPLILKQRVQEVVSFDKEQPGGGEVVILPEGVLLHCRLLSSVGSSDRGGVVVASLSKALIRSGVVLVPAGARLAGQLDGEQDRRVRFKPEWELFLPGGRSLEFRGSASERDFDLARRSYGRDDGRTGVPGEAAFEEKKGGLGKKLAGTAVSALARLGQERVRTVFGDQVPFTARNAALEGGAAIFDQYSVQPTKESVTKDAVVVAAGTEFYLTVLGGKRLEAATGTIEDDLWKELLKRRNGIR